MGYGDEIVAAGQAERIYASDPSRRVGIFDINRRPRWHDVWVGNPIIAPPADIERGEPVHVLISAPHARPYIVYPFDASTGWTFNSTFKVREHVAKIYLTEQEVGRGVEAQARYGPYVLIEPYTKHVNFRWPLERWTGVVAACPDLTFVQHIHQDSAPIPGARTEWASFREACGLAAGCDVYLRSESGMCHAAAALGVRQVTLFGGCMDPEVMAGYPGQTVLADTGPGSPCGSWRRCEHCQAAMERMTVDQVVQALRCSLQSPRPTSSGTLRTA